MILTIIILTAIWFGVLAIILVSRNCCVMTYRSRIRDPRPLPPLLPPLPGFEYPAAVFRQALRLGGRRHHRGRGRFDCWHHHARVRRLTMAIRDPIEEAGPGAAAVPTESRA